MADLEWARARVAERRADLEKWGPEIRVNRSIAAAKLAEAEDWLRQMEAEPPIAALRALVVESAGAHQHDRDAWAVERAALEASFLEAQLEIKALRGEPEGAVAEGWGPDHPGGWAGCWWTHERAHHALDVWPGPAGRGCWRCWLISDPGNREEIAWGEAPSVREAMRQADRWTP